MVCFLGPNSIVALIGPSGFVCRGASESERAAWRSRCGSAATSPQPLAGPDAATSVDLLMDCRAI